MPCALKRPYILVWLLSRSFESERLSTATRTFLPHTPELNRYLPTQYLLFIIFSGVVSVGGPTASCEYTSNLM